jgi:hypothetical protein
MSSLLTNVGVGSANTGVTGELDVAPDTNFQKALDGIASDLVAHLGVECFALDFKPQSEGTSQNVPGTVQRQEPVTIPIVSASDKNERDFWDEVAALSGGGVLLSPNAFGAKPDVVAYAIATVSARYTSASGELKQGVTLGLTNGTAPRTTPSPNNAGSSNGAVLNKPAALDECDLASVLDSFFDFEQVAELTSVSTLDSKVFERARQGATEAVVAANVIKNSAMKTAEGRRG